MRGSRREPTTATPPQHGHSLPGFLEKPPHVSCATWLPEDIRLLPEPRDHAAPAAQNCCVASGFPAWPLSSNPPPAQTLTPEPELRRRVCLPLCVQKQERNVCKKKKSPHSVLRSQRIRHCPRLFIHRLAQRCGSSLLPGSQQVPPVSIGCVIPGPVASSTPLSPSHSESTPH